METVVSVPFRIQVVAAGLPSWADYSALPNGTFIEFTLNQPNDVGMVSPNLTNWVGGAFVPDYGARGAACYHGGGEHFSWTDSDGVGAGEQGVWVLDCDTRLYKRVCYPDPRPSTHRGGVIGGDGYAGSPTDEWGAYMDDGSPQSKHTYNGCSYMPAAWGGGPQGSFIRCEHSGGISEALFNIGESQGYAATWRFDLSKAIHTAGDRAIYKLTGNNFYHSKSSDANLIDRTNDAPTACIDTIRQGWWSNRRTGTGTTGKMCFTTKTGEITNFIGGTTSVGWSAMHHFTDDDIIVRIVDDAVGTTEPVWQVYVWQANTSSNWVKIPDANVTRTAPEASSDGRVYPYIGYVHPRWSTILQKFVGLDYRYPKGTLGATRVRVWKLAPPQPGQRFTGIWAWEHEYIDALPGSGPTNVMNILGSSNTDHGFANGIYGRFVECPSLRAFVWTRDTSQKGQLLRLQGM